jgi:hypothetical protein
MIPEYPSVATVCAGTVELSGGISLVQIIVKSGLCTPARCAYSRICLSCAAAWRGVRSAASERSSKCCGAIVRTADCGLRTLTACTETLVSALPPPLCYCPLLWSSRRQVTGLGTPVLCSEGPGFRTRPRISWFPPV